MSLTATQKRHINEIQRTWSDAHHISLFIQEDGHVYAEVAEQGHDSAVGTYYTSKVFGLPRCATAKSFTKYTVTTNCDLTRLPDVTKALSVRL